jgi:glucan-binding YG repeat protein
MAVTKAIAYGWFKDDEQWNYLNKAEEELRPDLMQAISVGSDEEVKSYQAKMEAIQTMRDQVQTRICNENNVFMSYQELPAGGIQPQPEDKKKPMAHEAQEVLKEIKGLPKLDTQKKPKVSETADFKWKFWIVMKNEGPG